MKSVGQKNCEECSPGLLMNLKSGRGHGFVQESHCFLTEGKGGSLRASDGTCYGYEGAVFTQIHCALHMCSSYCERT